MEIWETIKHLDNLGIKVGYVLGGFFGALASLVWDKEKMSFRRAAAIVATGAIAAGYLTPIVSHLTGIPELFENSVGFLIGLAAMRICNKILNLIKSVELETIINIIRRKP